MWPDTTFSVAPENFQEKIFKSEISSHLSQYQDDSDRGYHIESLVLHKVCKKNYDITFWAHQYIFVLFIYFTIKLEGTILR